MLDNLAAQGNCNFTVIGVGNSNGRTPTFCSVLATINVAGWADVCDAGQQARFGWGSNSADQGSGSRPTLMVTLAPRERPGLR